MQPNQNSTDKCPKFPYRTSDMPQSSSTSHVQFCRAIHNPRFAITPQTIGPMVSCDTPSTSRDIKYSQECLVDIQSYCERHKNKQTDSNDFLTMPSPPPNTPPPNAYFAMREDKVDRLQTDVMNCKIDYNDSQTPSPNGSPKSVSQQWNFQYLVDNECSEEKTKSFMDNGNNFVVNATYPREQSESSGQGVQLQMCRSESDFISDSSVKLNFKTLNGIYVKRIEDIDTKAGGDKDLKLFTYQEWVDILTKVNESFISNMEDLEKEVEGRLNLVQRRVNSNCRHSQGNELMKCRKDINNLLKYIRNARNFNDWDLHELTFETISPSDVLEECDALTMDDQSREAIKHSNDPESMQRNKLFANMKALAHEVAEKHDEVRELKRQIVCLEDEIQNAQKKIQLKDDFIKEMKNELKSAKNKLSDQQSVDAGLGMPPPQFENQTSRSGSTHLTDSTRTFQMDNGSQYDTLRNKELEEQQNIKDLENEIAECFAMNQKCEQNVENKCKRFREMLNNLRSEKNMAIHKLDFIRRQLMDLAPENSSSDSNYDGDSGFHSKSESDQDAKIIDAIRKRLCKLSENNCELNKKLQMLKLQHSEMSNNLQSEKTFSERNSEILRQIADLISLVRGKQFFYTDIYSSSTNPFCKAIQEMQQEFKDRERELLNALAMKESQKEKTSELFLNDEKDFNSQQRILGRDTDNNTTTTTTTSSLLLSTSLQSLSVTAPTRGTPLQDPTTFLSTPLTGQPLANVTLTSPQGLEQK